MAKTVFVEWYDADDDDQRRRFGSFENAEAFARNLVRNDEAASGEVHISTDDKEVATIRMDGAGRIWTDLQPDGYDLLSVPTQPPKEKPLRQQHRCSSQN